MIDESKKRQIREILEEILQDWDEPRLVDSRERDCTEDNPNPNAFSHHGEEEISRNSLFQKVKCKFCGVVRDKPIYKAMEANFQEEAGKATFVSNTEEVHNWIDNGHGAMTCTHCGMVKSVQVEKLGQPGDPGTV